MSSLTNRYEMWPTRSCLSKGLFVTNLRTTDTQRERQDSVWHEFPRWGRNLDLFHAHGHIPVLLLHIWFLKIPTSHISGSLHPPAWGDQLPLAWVVSWPTADIDSSSSDLTPLPIENGPSNPTLISSCARISKPIDPGFFPRPAYGASVGDPVLRQHHPIDTATAILTHPLSTLPLIWSHLLGERVE